MSISSILLTLLIFFVAIFYAKKNGTIFNPVCGFLISHSFPLLLFAFLKSPYSNIESLSRYKDFDLSDVAPIYLLACISFMIPWLFNKKCIYFDYKKLNINKNINIKKIYILSIILLMDVLLCIAFLDVIPIFEMIKGNLSIQDHHIMLENLPIGLMAFQTGISMALCIIFNINIIYSDRFIHKNSILPLFAIFASATWQGSRQLALFFVFTLIVISSFRYNIFTIKRLIAVLFLLIIFINFFILVQDTRLHGQNSSPYEFIAYLTMPDINFHSILNLFNTNLDLDSLYIFRELIPHRFVGANYENYVMPILFEPTSPSGYLAYWFLDFQEFGIIFGSLMIGFASKIFYNRRNLSCKDFSCYILMLWVTFTSDIYSHFISLNNFIFPLILLFILPLNRMKSFRY